MAVKKNIVRGYRKVFGHKSPYRRVYGSRNAGQAIGVTYRQGMKVAKDLAQLKATVSGMKSRLNVEKKDIRSDVITDSFAQVNANSDGALIVDMTQAINQGIGETQRIGNSLKVTGMSIPIQLTGQIFNLSDRKIRITMLKVKSADNGVTGTEAFQKVWEVNPLSSVRDYNAPRAYRNSKTDGISIVRSMTTYFKAPQLDSSSIGTDTNERQQKCITMNLKLNDIWRYDTNADIYPSGLKYYLVFQADCGNDSTGTNSTLDVPVVGNRSGIDVRVYQRTWFVDN